MLNTINVDDPRITEMDPVQKIWLYENYIADQADQAELAKSHAYLLASFSHPESVKKILGTGGDIRSSTDEEFDELSELIRKNNQKDLYKDKGKKRRKKVQKLT